ncbi:GIY-YIG nuclease family protein [Streptomyces sioyaensis]
MGNRSTAVYRLFDSEGALLYVGISVSPERRFEEHSKNLVG